MPRSDRLISLALQGPSTAIRFSPVRTRDLINLMLSDDEFPCGQFGDLMADRTGLYASDFYFARGRVRCFFVAGFKRIRCDSVEGIRILTNPATLNTHHSQYQCHSISPTARTGQDRTDQSLIVFHAVALIRRDQRPNAYHIDSSRCCFSNRSTNITKHAGAAGPFWSHDSCGMHSGLMIAPSLIYEIRSIRHSYRRPVCERLRHNFRTSALTWVSQCRIILTEYRSRSQRCVFRYARSM